MLSDNSTLFQTKIYFKKLDLQLKYSILYIVACRTVIERETG